MNDEFRISPELADEIEDAIMFGRSGALEAIIENIADVADFPAELRDGLQSLHYFRSHYGSRPLSEVDRKKAGLMESAWAMELLNKIRARVEPAAKSA
jgi:hypothetical protein